VYLVTRLPAQRTKPSPLRYTARMVRVSEIDGQRYRWIPPGIFVMGCSPGDAKCYPDEIPAHEVTISKGFWMAETVVTSAMYRRFAAAEGVVVPFQWRVGDALPIDSVTWSDALHYCKWAGGRLPTEAEWEYAARAGTAGPHYGSLRDIAWYGFLGGRTQQAGAQKQPNAFGLYDMLGNVWEWTADWYGKTYYQTSPPVDPPGPPEGERRALRGGAWYNGSGWVRASHRNSMRPDQSHYGIGFRCVCDWQGGE